MNLATIDDASEELKTELELAVEREDSKEEIDLLSNAVQALENYLLHKRGFVYEVVLEDCDCY